MGRVASRILVALAVVVALVCLYGAYLAGENSDRQRVVRLERRVERLEQDMGKLLE
jgi:CHASE1-domain containing sensor protein